MARSGRKYLDDVPDEVGDRLRTICLDFPDAYEQQAWAGTRWMVRKKTFAHVLAVAQDERDPDIVLSFRSSDEEAESLRRTGHPFFALGWGRNAIGMVLDDSNDWDEVRELMTESFCVMAPKKLVALVDRPPE